MKNRIYILIATHLLLFTQPSLLFANGRVKVNKDTSAKVVYMAAMDSMMGKMAQSPAAQSPEADFLQQMVPHHQGAIEMAAYEIKHGKNFEMVQLAKSIKAEQEVEIGMMTGWLKSSSLPKEGVPIDYTKAMRLTMDTMMDCMMEHPAAKEDDYAFAEIMIPHHQAAIDMAKVILKYSNDPTITAFAKQLISNEQIEIEQMSSFIK